MYDELLGQLPRYAAGREEGRMAAVRRYLDERCTEALTFDALAAHFHVSKYHLSRDFKRQVGETIFGYLTRRRMDLATYLLAHGDRPVSQVAQACGYAEASTFFYAFREHTGMAPTAYRKAQREAEVHLWG